MKRLILSLTALVLSTAMFAQKKSDELAKFATETIDQGKLKQNNPEEVRFIVTNISKEPLIIEQANPTCGCTISDYTKEPIANGKAGTIKATYNAANVGAFEKHLTVKFAGVDEVKSITIKGEVLTKDDFAKLSPATDAVVKPVATTTTTTTTTTTDASTKTAPAKKEVKKKS